MISRSDDLSIVNLDQGAPGATMATMGGYSEQDFLPMSNSDNWLVHEHSLYEGLLTWCQDAFEMEDWETVSRVFNELVTHLKRHMALEEEVQRVRSGKLISDDRAVLESLLYPEPLTIKEVKSQLDDWESKETDLT